MTMTTCSTCGADIFFVKMDTGGTMPCNPDGRKNIVKLPDGTGKVMTGYTSHFATCPQADEHRGTGAEKSSGVDKDEPEA